VWCWLNDDKLNCLIGKITLCHLYMDSNHIVENSKILAQKKESPFVHMC